MSCIHRYVKREFPGTRGKATSDGRLARWRFSFQAFRVLIHAGFGTLAVNYEHDLLFSPLKKDGGSFACGCGQPA